MEKNAVGLFGLEEWHILLVTICLFFPLSWSWPFRTWANGGTPRLTAVEAGPYLISAWSQPDPPQVGRLHVSVAVMTPSTQEAILDATVQLVAELAGQRKQPIVVQATHEAGANALLYHGNFELPQAGPWQITVLVEGPAGPGQSTFSLQVEPPGSGGLFRVGAGGIVIGLVLVWMVWRRRRLPAVRSERRSP